MEIESEIGAKRAIALAEMAPEEALELLLALKQCQPTPEAMALDHLMSGESGTQGC
ncbi:MAG: hypothetical protein AB7T59_18940 [Hyphomonadaceae bacterium]